jgi:hypothetical protein
MCVYLLKGEGVEVLVVLAGKAVKDLKRLSLGQRA